MSAFKLTHARSGSETARARKRIGDTTEAEVQHALNEAARLSVAHITKRPTPVRVVSVTKGRVSGFFERSPGVDYCGTLRGGRAVFVEVKSCHEGTFPLREIEPEQWAEMARALDLGAVCALVVRWQPPTDKGRALLEGRSFAWCVVPWVIAEHLRSRGGASVSAELLALHAVDASRLWVEQLALMGRKTGG